MAKEKNTGSGYVKKETMVTVAIIALGIGFLGGAVLSAYKFGAEESLPPAGPPQQQVAPGMPQANAPSPDIAGQIPILERETAMNPDNVGAWTQLGNLYFDTGQFQKAIDAYKKSLALNPNNADVWTDMGVMYRRNGQPLEAIQAFDKAVAVDPGHEVSRFNKGIVLMHDLEDSKSAIQAWNELVEMNPLAKTPNGQLLKDMIDRFRGNRGGN